MENETKEIPASAFPNLPSLNKELVEQVGKLITTKPGYTWYSICSTHRYGVQGCPRCHVGRWCPVET